jgi:integral membrane protein
VLKTPLGRFRFIAWIQAIAYLLILFVAYPLKSAGMPQAVTIFGNIYGATFLLLVMVLIYARSALDWSLIRPIIIFFVSFIPLGLIVMDLLWMRKWEDGSLSRSA